MHPQFSSSKISPSRRASQETIQEFAMADKPGDGAILLLFPEIIRRKKATVVEELLLDTCYDIIRTKTFAFTENEAEEALRETPRGWNREALLVELTRGLCSVLLVQHPLGKTRKRLADSLAAATTAAEAVTTGEEDETGLVEAFRNAFCIEAAGPQQFYFSTCRWTFERDVLFFYPSEACPERAIDVLVLEDGLIILASVEFRLGQHDVAKLFPDIVNKCTCAIFLTKELRHVGQHKQLDQQKEELRKLFGLKSFIILWEKEQRLEKKLIDILCQEWQDRPDYSAIVSSLKGQDAPGSLCGRARRCIGFASATEEEAAALAAACSMKPLPLLLLPPEAPRVLEAGSKPGKFAALGESDQCTGTTGSLEVLVLEYALFFLKAPGSYTTRHSAPAEQQTPGRGSLKALCKERPRPQGLAAIAWIGHWLEGAVKRERQLKEAIEASAELAASVRPGGGGHRVTTKEEHQQQGQKICTASTIKCPRVVLLVGFQQPEQKDLQLPTAKLQAPILSAGLSCTVEALRRSYDLHQRGPEKHSELLRETAMCEDPATALRTLLARKLPPHSSSRTRNFSGCLLVSLEEDLCLADWKLLTQAFTEVQPLTVAPSGASFGGAAAAAAHDSAKATGRLLTPFNINDEAKSSGILYDVVADVLRPSLVFVFSDPGLPLRPLLECLCCCFGLAHIDMDKEIALAAGYLGFVVSNFPRSIRQIEFVQENLQCRVSALLLSCSSAVSKLLPLGSPSGKPLLEVENCRATTEETEAQETLEKLQDGALLSRAVNRLAWLRRCPMVALQMPPALLGPAESLERPLVSAATGQVPDDKGPAPHHAKAPSAALLHFAMEGKAKRISVTGEGDLGQLKDEISSVLRRDVVAMIASKGLSKPLLGEAVAKILGLKLIPDFEKYVNQQQQGAAPVTRAPKVLFKGSEQAKGKPRTPADVAEVLRALQKPHGHSPYNGVLLVDVLDSIERKLENYKLPLSRIIIVEAAQGVLEEEAAQDNREDRTDGDEEELDSRLSTRKNTRELIAEAYKDRCLRIRLSPAATAALALSSEGSSGEEEEDSSPSSTAAGNARAAATREIADALYKRSVILLADGLLPPTIAQTVREGLALSLSSQLFILESNALGFLLVRPPVIENGCTTAFPYSWFFAEMSAAADIWRITTTELQIQESPTAADLSPQIQRLLQQLQEPPEPTPLELLQLNHLAPDPSEEASQNGFKYN
ncbi:nucleoside diphosphate [Cyclospora cayetanensis]|uniref:Nucleoside diphosphate n=1 Tax=Cyclospora cayetanensis TaxID=88456 RepID=A0A1D3D2P8_9EIME|nr:nucleoside diphosphate [Cyclospora cayetanensis]